MDVQEMLGGGLLSAYIPTLPKTQQYVYGLQDGSILRKIHSIPAHQIQESWEARFNRKIDRKIEMYNACPMKYESGERLIEYINEHRHLLTNRPQTYQHGDYHIAI